MRRLIVISLLLAMLSAVSALAAQGTWGTYGQQGQKDECLLVAKNCENNRDTIQQRIERLNREISKGTAVYTNEELRKLKDQLNELQDVLMKDRPAS